MSNQAIGRYRLLRDLGQGAAAHVYLARDPASGRQVAVKLLAAAYTAAPGFAAEFDRALKAVAALDHPYLVPLLDFGQEDDQFFVVQRYMPGGTLADRLDGRPMLLSEVLVILERLASALDAAHTAGLYHGDLNPAHVLFDINGRAFITDLGLAPLLQDAGTATQPGLPGLPGATTAAGWDRFVTPAYMSPEQAAGEGADSRSDVYALGIILFEMLTGRQPYVALTADAVVRQHIEGPIPSLNSAALSLLVLPEEFNQVMARALSKQRDLRYPTAGVLADAMRTMFLTAPPVAEPAVSAPPEAVPQPLVTPAITGEPPLPPPPAPPEAPALAAAPPPPPPPTLVAFEPSGREPAEILRSEPPLPPPAPSRSLLGLGGIGLIIIIGLVALARWTNLGGWGLTPTPTATATPTLTATFTATPVPTATASPSPSPTATLTHTPTATATRTASPTRTRTRTPTATETNTRAPTQPAFTATPAPTSTIPGAALPLPDTPAP